MEHNQEGKEDKNPKSQTQKSADHSKDLHAKDDKNKPSMKVAKNTDDRGKNSRGHTMKNDQQDKKPKM
jgi:hypothetical protein